ncbi:peptidylprolyl isomerase [Patescibacteria group bacterium]
MKTYLFFAAIVLILLGTGCTQTTTTTTQVDDSKSNEITKEETTKTMHQGSSKFPGALPTEEITNKQIKLSTEKGEIVFELYPETAPLAVSNFVRLSTEGYFDGLTFHRREEGFVIQGGDPSGNGTGGPGYTFIDELEDDYKYERGVVAMANRGPDTNGSQFFIMLGDTPLPKSYTIFGRVTEGLEVVDQIVVGDKMTKVTVEELVK